MRPTSYLPLLYEVVLLASFSTLILGAGLFPWGTHNGDTIVWESDDSNDGYTLTLERPFNFNGVMRDEITIDYSGALNFDDDYSDDNAFPTLAITNLDNVVAAFWDYLECEFGYYRETQNESFIQDAGMHVRQTFGIQDFEPTWAFITTWINCHHYENTDGPVYEDYNFQNVLLQDENNVSYALFMYGTMNGRNNLMSPTIGVHTLVDGTKTYVELCHGALGDIVRGRKQSQCQTMPGMRAFRTDVITSMPCIRAHHNSKGCRKDSDCTDSNCLLCDTRTKNCVECVECASNEECPDLRPTCAMDGCCKCVNDSNCPKHSPVCNADGSCEARHVCPKGKKVSIANTCAKFGRPGGYCFFGRCLGQGVVCNLSTNTCEYHGRKQRKPKLTCDDKRRTDKKTRRP